MLTFKILKQHALAIHIQLREQIKYQIESGVLKSGTKLPTVRELASKLLLNYNTVRNVYKDLERLGFVYVDQGRGVFVTDKTSSSKVETKKLDELLEEALIEATSLGISTDDLLLHAFSRASEKRKPSHKINLLFLECNQADLKHHLRTIRKNLRIVPKGCLFSELPKKKTQFLFNFDIVATTMYHYFEAKEIVGPEINLFGMVVQPSISNVVSKIAALPENTLIGLLCTTESNANKMKQALVGSGLTHVKFVTSGLNKTKRIKSIFKNTDEVFVSRMGMNAHSGTWPFGKTVQMYEDDLDPRALYLLRQELETHQTKVLNG